MSIVSYFVSVISNDLKYFNNMKKAGFVLFLAAVCTTVMFTTTLVNANNVLDDWEDHVALSREGGTTRVASRSMYGIQSFAAEPMIETQVENNVLIISVEDYRGPVLVEIYGARGAKQSFFQVYDMGVDVVNISEIGTGEFDIRVTLSNSVYTGTINKRKYGIRK